MKLGPRLRSEKCFLLISVGLAFVKDRIFIHSYKVTLPGPISQNTSGPGTFYGNVLSIFTNKINSD